MLLNKMVAQNPLKKKGTKLKKKEQNSGNKGTKLKKKGTKFRKKVQNLGKRYKTQEKGTKLRKKVQNSQRSRLRGGESPLRPPPPLWPPLLLKHCYCKQNKLLMLILPPLMQILGPDPPPHDVGVRH